VQFWDGRARNVEEQAKGPVLNPVEMAAPNEKHVLAVLTSIPNTWRLSRRPFRKTRTPSPMTIWRARSACSSANSSLRPVGQVP